MKHQKTHYLFYSCIIFIVIIFYLSSVFDISTIYFFLILVILDLPSSCQLIP